MQGRQPNLPLVAWSCAVSLATPCLANDERPPDAPSDPPTATEANEVREEFGDAWRTSVSLQAPPKCATTEELKQGIRRRTSHLELVDDPAASKRVFADLRYVGGRHAVAATLVIERPGEATLERSIQADSCEEAVDALAFMAAVALDPESVAWDAEATEPQDPPAQEPPEVPAEPVSVPSGWTPFVGGGLHVAWSVAPAPLFGPELLGGFEKDTGSFVAPLVRLGASHVVRGDLEQRGGTAHFRLTTASLDLCPLAVAVSPLTLRPCGFVAAGMLRAEGTDTLDPRRIWRPWGVVGGSVIALWKPVAPVGLSLTARFGRPLVRDTFEFEPNAFHEVPGWAANASGALEVELP